jgi:hypothetical protein
MKARKSPAKNAGGNNTFCRDWVCDSKTQTDKESQSLPTLDKLIKSVEKNKNFHFKKKKLEVPFWQISTKIKLTGKVLGTKCWSPLS